LDKKSYPVEKTIARELSKNMSPDTKIRALSAKSMPKKKGTFYISILNDALDDLSFLPQGRIPAKNEWVMGPLSCRPVRLFVASLIKTSLSVHGL